MPKESPNKKTGMKVYGVPGNTNYGYGSLDSGEYLPKLQGQAGMHIYNEMRKSDPQVRSVLDAIMLPVMNGNYRVEPASKSPKDIEIAEIIEKNLFEEMSLTWKDTLRHALLMLPFGFSILEKVWEVKDGLYKIKKLAPRLPISVVSWDYDKEKRQLIGPVQQDTDGTEYPLPIEKLVVYVNKMEGDDFSGTSALRSAYKPWFIKSKMEKVNAIKHDRYGVGIPVAEVPPNVKPDSQEWRDTQNALESIYSHQSAYVIEPEGYKFRMLSSDSGGKAGTDVLPTIQYYDEMIAKSMLAMFISLGTSQSGSRALGGSFIDYFMESLQTYADYICEVTSRFLIREYVDYNWYVDEYPVMKVGLIKSLDTVTIATLIKAGVVTYDEAMEASVRAELNLPEKVEGKEPEPEGDPADQENEEEMEDIPGEEEGNQEEDTDEGKALAEKSVMDKLHKEKQDVLLRELKDRSLPTELYLQVQAHMKGGGTHGEKKCKNALNASRYLDDNLAPEEKIPNLAGIEMRLNDSSRDTRATVLNIREVQANDIIMQIVTGRKPNKIRVIHKKEMYDNLMKTYKAELKEGRAEVQEELQKQKDRAGSLADGAPEDYDDFIKYEDEKLQVEVEGAGNKLVSQLLLLSLSYSRQGISGQELESAMLNSWEEAISPRTWNNMSDGAVNGGWGAGRTIEGNRHKDEIAYAYYSSVLDKNTCAWCWQKDGTRHEVGDPAYATPSPECAGTENLCRCINVYVLKAEAA